MRQIGAYEAKTHLAELLNKVMQGESFLLTRHGQVVAMLTQPSGRERASTHEVINELHQLRRGIRLDGIPLKSLIEEGRKCVVSSWTTRSSWPGALRTSQALTPDLPSML